MSLMGRGFYRLCESRFGHGALRAAAAATQKLGLLDRFDVPREALRLDQPELAALSKLWSRIHWSSGDGMMPARQLLTIFRLAARWPVSGDIVELGAWTGLTTCYLATANRLRGSGHVYAVDTFAGTREGDTNYKSIARYNGSTLPTFEARIEQAELGDLVTPLRGLTTDVAETYCGDPIRVLLIDADHSYAGVRADYECWSPHMAPGGLIIFHDYDMDDIRRFVDTQIRADDRVCFEPGLPAENIAAVTWRGTITADRPTSDTRRAAPAGTHLHHVLANAVQGEDAGVLVGGTSR